MSHFGCSAGQELHPTQYMWRRQDRPFHLDYVFASDDLLSRLSDVEVGRYADWHGISDHMPLVASFTDALTD